MAIPSGIDAQLGWSEESTYGTYVAPTKFGEFNSENIQYNIERTDSAAIRAGNFVLRSDRWATNKKGASGTIVQEAQSKGLGLLFKHAHGSSVITTPSGATNTRDHTYTLASQPANTSLTVQVGRPDVGGTVRAFSYLGCKIPKLTISNSVDEILQLEWDIDAQDETTAQALAAASYPATTELLYWGGGSATIGGSSVDIIDVKIEMERKLKLDRYFIRTNQLKKEQLLAGMSSVTGEVTVEFSSLTDYNRFTGGTMGAVVLLWEGSIIEAGGGATINPKFGLQITLATCRFDGETPNVDSPDVLTHKLKFMALNDGTNPPISTRYRTTDTVD